MSYPEPPDPHGPSGPQHHGPQSGGYPPPYDSQPHDMYSGGYPPPEQGMNAPVPYNAQHAGGWQAPVPQQPAGGWQPIAMFGDITVTQTEVITPGASFPLAGSTWSINDMTHVEQRMATWALPVALIGFFLICVFSLFFLMVKETTVNGGIQVSVRSGPHFHTAMIPVHSVGQARTVHQQFNYVRSLAVR